MCIFDVQLYYSGCHEELLVVAITVRVINGGYITGWRTAICELVLLDSANE